MQSKRHRSPRTDNLKCVLMDNGTVHRLNNEKARDFVVHGRASYIPKRTFKEGKNAQVSS